MAVNLIEGRFADAELNTPKTVSWSFDAPNVTENQQLTYEITVTDNGNATTKKEITIHIIASEGDIEDITFADDNFKQCVFDTALHYNLHLVTDFTELKCGHDFIKSASDLTAFVNLTYLDLSWNELTSLDLSAQTLLTQLNLGYNELTNINLSAQ